MGLLRGSAARRAAPASFVADVAFLGAVGRDRALGPRSAGDKSVGRPHRLPPGSAPSRRRPTATAGTHRWLQSCRNRFPATPDAQYSFGMGTEGANGPRRSGPADRRLLTP